MHQQNPIPLRRANTCSSALIFFTNMFLLVGFILTVVGSVCSLERSLTRIVGPIFLGIGLVLLISTVEYTRTRPRNNNAGQGIAEPTSQIGSTTQGELDNVTTTTQYPSPHGFQQPYGQTPEYPWGTGPYPPPPAGTLCHPTGPAYPSSSRYPYNSSQNGQPAYPTEIPPPPSYESVVGQSDSAQSAHTKTQVYWKGLALRTWMDTGQDHNNKTRRAAYVFTYTTSGASESFYLKSYSNKCMPFCTAALGSRHQITARVRNLISGRTAESLHWLPVKGWCIDI